MGMSQYVEVIRPLQTMRHASKHIQGRTQSACYLICSTIRGGGRFGFQDVTGLMFRICRP